MHRRQFLRGAGGVVMALPFMEGLSGDLLAQDANAHSFGVFIRHPHGVVHEDWWPEKLGKLSKETMPDNKACSLLAPHAERTMYIRGLKMGWGNSNCHHNMHGVQLFTGGRPIFSPSDMSQGKALSSHESIDWTIARQFHPGTEPLVLLAGTRESGIINDTISFRKEGEKAIGENDPYAVYKRIFNVTSANQGLENGRKSVNDYVLAQLKTLAASPRLSKDDKERLDLHLTAIRTTEKKIEAVLPEAKESRLKQISASQGSLYEANKNRLNEVIMLQMDIIALAIASGAVRGVSYQLLAGIDGTRFTLDGKQLLNSHGASHLEASGNREENIATLRRLDRFWVECVSYLATQLANYKVNGKPLVDYGVIMATTEISQGQSHSENNIPHILVGSANGRLKTGSYSDFGEISNGQLLATVGAAIGLKSNGQEITSFGIGHDRDKKRTGRVDALLA